MRAPGRSARAARPAGALCPPSPPALARSTPRRHDARREDPTMIATNDTPPRPAGDRGTRWLIDRIPVGLTSLRAALAPVVVLLAWWRPEPLAFVVCLSIAFVSDVLDGIVARRL